jgi:hypothetical protein
VECWSEAELNFYRGKYEDYSLFLRKGYRPRKGNRGTNQECYFWRKNWKVQADVANTNKTAVALSNLRNAVAKVIDLTLDSTGNEILAQERVNADAQLYLLYGKDFKWNCTLSAMLAPVFPRNVTPYMEKFVGWTASREAVPASEPGAKKEVNAKDCVGGLLRSRKSSSYLKLEGPQPDNGGKPKAAPEDNSSVSFVENDELCSTAVANSYSSVYSVSSRTFYEVGAANRRRVAPFDSQFPSGSHQ